MDSEFDSKKSYNFFFGILLLALVGFGSIFAANITITKPQTSVEFGEGVYKIKACDTYIHMNLISGATGELGAPPGLSPLRGISISSLNPTACKNTTFTINAFDTTSYQIPLYRTDSQIALCTDLPCTPGVNSANDVTINISSNAQVALANPDSFHDLTYDKTTGVYKVNFQQPTILANEIGNLTIQSAPLAK